MHGIKTLIILSPGFPINEADSTCMPPQQVFLRALKANYPKLHIIVLAFEYPYVKSDYNWHGIQVIPFAGKNKSRLPRLLNWTNIWHKLKHLNKQHQVIGLLSFWFDECAFIGHLFAKKHRLKHFSWLLGQDAKPGNRYFKWIKPGGESLIALSDFVCKQVYQNYKIKPLHIITTGIDTSMFKVTKQARTIDILGVGSLITLKRYDVFIYAVKSASKYLPNIKAVIYGNGPEKERLIALINELSLQSNVLLRYEIPQKEVLNLMQQSKVFLHTSNYEGFGAVLLEALYAGTQVVSFVRPMDMPIDHHHVVNTADEMNDKLFELLSQPNPDNEPILPFRIESVANSMMKLFYNEEITPDISLAIASKESL